MFSAAGRREMDVQWAILGTGEPYYHDVLGQLAREFPNRVAARLEFSDPLAHRIEAGADIFLMPSRYEPCGLNQLYSFEIWNHSRRSGHWRPGRYSDGYDARNPPATDGNRLFFEALNASVLEATLRRAVETYWQNPTVWRQLVETGMQRIGRGRPVPSGTSRFMPAPAAAIRKSVSG